jgi:hypothetical protein
MYQKYMLAAEEILKKISPSQILQQAQIWKIVSYLSISEICPDQEGGFVGWGLIKKEGIL